MTSDPRVVLAKKVFDKLGEIRDRSIFGENDAGHLYIVFGVRRLVFEGPNTISYGSLERLQKYDTFADIESAIHFLEYPDLPPKAIVDDVETILAGVVSQGVRLGYVTVDWSAGYDRPVIKTLDQPYIDVRFGLRSARSINRFELDEDKGLTSPERAIIFLLGMIE